LSESTFSLGAHARARGLPSLAEAVSATGGIAVALGVLLITIDIRADNSGRAAESALFAALVLAGYLVVLLLPAPTHPAGIAAVVLGIPGAIGWAVLPGAHRFEDVRPFLVLTILAWIIAFVVPRTRGRTIFVAVTALFLWLWILGEVAGTGAFSAAPIPSPPAHTLFSLESFATVRATVTLGDLDPNDPLYPLAQECSFGDGVSCDALYRQAPAGTDFHQFAATCGNAAPGTENEGNCANLTITQPGASIPTLSPFPTVPLPTSPVINATTDKSFDIGLVSVFFGVVYLLALFVLDRGRLRGLATAFVIPGFVALLSGTQSLGSAAHHAWVGGLLTFVAGIGIGIVGDLTGRRFTTWAGGFAVALGALIVAGDASHVSHAVRNGTVELAGPGLLVMSFGAGLVATAYVISQLLRPRDPDVPEEPRPQPPFLDGPGAAWGTPAADPGPAPEPPADPGPAPAPPADPTSSWPPQP
jgi:hypothetical protein